MIGKLRSRKLLLEQSRKLTELTNPARGRRRNTGRRCLRLSDDGATIISMTPAERDAFRSTRSDVRAFMSEPELGRLGYKHVIRYTTNGEKFVTLEPMTESDRRAFTADRPRLAA